MALIPLLAGGLLAQMFSRGQSQQRAAAAEQAAADQRTADTRNLMAAGGLNDPTAQNAALMNTINSPFSDISGAGLALYKSQVKANTPEGRMARERSRQVIDLAAAGEERAQAGEQRAAAAEERAAALFPGQLAQQGLTTETMRMKNAAAAAELALPPLDAVPTELPKELDMVHPVTQRPVKVQVSGPEYEKQQASIDAFERAMATIGDFTALVDEVGSEWTGEHRTTLSNMRNSIIFETVRARGGGAPQEAELELAGEGLPDPTSTMANLRGVAQGAIPVLGPLLRENQEQTIIAGYENLWLEHSRAVLDMLNRNPTLDVDLSLLHPAAFSSPNEIEHYRANTGSRLLFE